VKESGGKREGGVAQPVRSTATAETRKTRKSKILRGIKSDFQTGVKLRRERDCKILSRQAHTGENRTMKKKGGMTYNLGGSTGVYKSASGGGTLSLWAN